MVGGIVIGLVRLKERTHVTVAGCPHYPKHGRGDECSNPDTLCVHTDERKVSDGERVEIGIGDSFWWQSGKCYWTSKENRGKDGDCGVDFDIALTKLGYSH